MSTWIRALVPSWRFFDAHGPRPILYLRSNPKEDWKEALERPNRHLFSIFINPKGNLYLREATLVYQFVEALGELGPKLIYTHPSFSILESILWARHPSLSQMEFKLCAREINGDLKIEEKVLFESKILERLK